MIKTVLILLGFITLLGCHKICTPSKYACYGGVATIYPDVDSIQLGDTLRFNTTIPINVKYSQANSSDSSFYNLSGATNIVTDLHVTTPTGINMQEGAVDSFNFILIKGNIKSNPLIPNAAKTISYLEEGGMYHMSVAMVAKKKGVYCLSIIDIYQAEKKCDKISVITVMSNPDNHLHYLQDIYYGGGLISSIDLTHSYCFKVY